MYLQINARSALQTFVGSAIAAAMHGGWNNSASTAEFQGHGKVNGCSLSGFTPSFPPGQTQLTVPNASAPQFIGLAFGVQNYTCSSSNNYTSTGAIAELIDVSCYTSAPFFDTIQDELLPAWDALSQQISIQQALDFVHSLNLPASLAQHYFVPNPVTGQGLSPKWDFTSSGRFAGNADAFIVGKSVGSLPSPDDASKDVTWLQVQNVQGEIADTLFRFDTVGGQPPSSCTSGESSDVSVNYVAKYIFYGGSL